MSQYTIKVTYEDGITDTITAGSFSTTGFVIVPSNDDYRDNAKAMKEAIADKKSVIIVRPGFTKIEVE